MVRSPLFRLRPMCDFCDPKPTAKVYDAAPVATVFAGARILFPDNEWTDVGLNSISMNNDRFKQYAWSTTKGRKVFNQIADFGVTGDYDESGDGELDAKIWIKGDENAETAYALQDFVKELINASGDDSIALERFKRADMTVFA